jgi:hypothetical protein
MATVRGLLWLSTSETHLLGVLLVAVFGQEHIGRGLGGQASWPARSGWFADVRYGVMVYASI